MTRQVGAGLQLRVAVVRGDAGFSMPRVLDGLDALHAERGGIEYVLSLQRNAAVQGRRGAGRGRRATR